MVGETAPSLASVQRMQLATKMSRVVRATQLLKTWRSFMPTVAAGTPAHTPARYYAHAHSGGKHLHPHAPKYSFHAYTGGQYPPPKRP